MESIEHELKHLRLQIRKLNKRKQEIKEQTITHMIKKKQTTCNIKNKVYLIEESEKRQRKKESDKKKDTIEYLKQFSDKPEEAYKEILNRLRGEPQKTYKLKNQHKNKKK